MRALTRTAAPEGRKAGDAVWASAYKYKRGTDRMDLHQLPVNGMLAAGQGPDAHRKALAAGITEPAWFVPFKKSGEPNWKRSVPAWKRDYADTYEEAVMNYDERVDECAERLRAKLDKVLSDRIRPVPRMAQGTLVSEWDDGETTVECDCEVDLSTREITVRDPGHRTVFSADPDIGPDNVDDAVDNLDREYVRIGEEEFPAAPKDDLDPDDEETFWYE